MEINDITKKIIGAAIEVHKILEPGLLEKTYELCLIQIVELKATNEILPIHRAQILSYMRLSHIKTGLIINFHVSLLKDGIERFTNKAQPS